VSASAAAAEAGAPAAAFSRLEPHRIERALRQRSRYRYVRPQVLPEGGGWRIVSPCCSRRVDAAGGIIDIAWLEPLGGHRWRLHAREHAAARWRAVDDGPLPALLERLSSDPLHQFWI